MMYIIGQITISEVLLLFVLLFVIPGMAYMVLRLRKYERLHGALPDDKPVKKPRASLVKDTTVPGTASVDADDYSYRRRAFLPPSDLSCLQALREALGEECDVFYKVALWELIEPAKADDVLRERLLGKDLDFLICDRETGTPMTAVLFSSAEESASEEIKRICDAAESDVVFLNRADEYDAVSLRESLGIADFSQ